jgi:hypothetical protein
MYIIGITRMQAKRMYLALKSYSCKSINLSILKILIKNYMGFH